MNIISKNQKGFSAVEAVLVLVVVTLIGVVGWLVYKDHRKAVTTNITTTTSNKSSMTTTDTSDICYLESANIDCVNQNGRDAKAYALPLVNDESVEQLAPNQDDTQYVASTNKGHIYILNESLAEVSKVSVPSGLNTSGSNLPSWSHDGKSLFMELDTSDNSSYNWRQIYRYDISAQKWTQLTSANLNSTPFQTADGHIVYLYMNGDFHTNTNGWEPYIMNSDGTDAKPFTSYVNSSDYSAAYTSSSAPSLDLNYDMKTDTVFVDPAESQFTYETVSDLLSGKEPTTIPVSAIQGSVFPGSLARVSNSELLYITSAGQNQPQEGLLINMANGNVTSTIDNFGTYIIGVLPNVSLL